MITFNLFLEALNRIETNGRKDNVPAGDNGQAIGPLQIHRKCWEDAVAYMRRRNPRAVWNLPYSACKYWEAACVIAMSYLMRYAPHAMMVGDWEVLARVWNGGPTGHRKAATLPYWKKVEPVLKELEKKYNV